MKKWRWRKGNERKEEEGKEKEEMEIGWNMSVASRICRVFDTRTRVSHSTRRVVADIMVSGLAQENSTSCTKPGKDQSSAQGTRICGSVVTHPTPVSSG